MSDSSQGSLDEAKKDRKFDIPHNAQNLANIGFVEIAEYICTLKHWNIRLFRPEFFY